MTERLKRPSSRTTVLTQPPPRGGPFQAGQPRRRPRGSGHAGVERARTLRSRESAMQAFEARPPPLTTGPDGVVRVAGTRVPLETILTAFDAGATAEEIAQQYASVDLASVYAVISYVLDHRREVDEYAMRRRDEAAHVRDEIEAQISPAGLRARLLASTTTSS